MELEQIRQMMSAMVPFNQTLGISIVSLGDGVGTAELPNASTLSNHLGTQHAGALFAVGEAASGAAMSGTLASVLLEVSPVAKTASVAYKKAARGVIRAHAALDGVAADTLRTTMNRDGRVEFAVSVSLRDPSDVEVATMSVVWNVRKRA